MTNIEKAKEFLEKQSINGNSPLNITIENGKVVLLSVEDTGRNTLIIPDFIDRFEVRHLGNAALGPMAKTNYTNVIVMADLESCSMLFAGMDSSRLDVCMLGHNCKYTTYMFAGCRKLRELNIRNFDTTRVENMEGMFTECTSLYSIRFPLNMDTRNVTDTSRMFAYCYGLRDVNIERLEFNKVYDANSMFSNCRHLEKLDLSNFNMQVALARNTEAAEFMFDNCFRLNFDNIGLSKETRDKMGEKAFQLGVYDAFYDETPDPEMMKYC